MDTTKSFDEQREKAARVICGCPIDNPIPNISQTNFIEAFKSGSSWTLAYLVNHPDELNELIEESKALSRECMKN